MKYQNGKGSASFVMFLNIASHSMGSMSGVWYICYVAYTYCTASYNH
jgi:hypothetical protein